jgi:hypothetical protein
VCNPKDRTQSKLAADMEDREAVALAGDRGRRCGRSGGGKQRVRVQRAREIGDNGEMWMIRRQAWVGGAAIVGVGAVALAARSPWSFWQGKILLHSEIFRIAGVCVIVLIDRV